MLSDGMTIVKYFALQSQTGCSSRSVILPVLPQSDRTGQRVAGWEALFYHLVEPALVDRVGEQIHQLGAERREIVRLATRQQLLVELNLLVHPCSASVL